jgi:hypothetical protein
MKQIACPIALHPDGTPLRLALAIDQTLPPMIEFQNDAAPAAARHLFETLGLETRSAVTIGMSTEIAKACAVHFVLCRIAPPVRDQWKHLRPDGITITANWVNFEALPSNAAFRWIVANL